MDATDLLTKFARIGARLKVADRPTRRSRATSGVITLDVRADRNGEFFEVVSLEGPDPGVAVLDVRPADRHLLLLVREGGEKHKFLCGHDERHWFVAVPEAAPVGTVRQAEGGAQARRGPGRPVPPRAPPRPATAARTPPTAAPPGRVVLPAGPRLLLGTSGSKCHRPSRHAGLVGLDGFDGRCFFFLDMGHASRQIPQHDHSSSLRPWTLQPSGGRSGPPPGRSHGPVPG